MDRVLLLTHCPPEEPWSGERRRVDAARRYFSSRADLTVHVVRRDDAALSRLKRKVRVPAAPPYAARFHAPAIEWSDFDAIWVFEAWAMSCVPRRTQSRALWDKDTLMGASFTDHSTSFSTGLSAAAVTAYEKRVLRRTAWNFLSNASDVSAVGDDRASLLPNGIRYVRSRPANLRADDQLVLGFTGRLDYAPNVEGLLRFAEHLFPNLRRAAATTGLRAQLLVAGAGLQADIADRVASHSGVSILGYVDKIADFYERIDIALAPMLRGAGTPTKVIEALGHGVPVLGSAVGLRGLAAQLQPWTDLLPSEADLDPEWVRDHIRPLVAEPREQLVELLEPFLEFRLFETAVQPVLDRLCL